MKETKCTQMHFLIHLLIASMIGFMVGLSLTARYSNDAVVIKQEMIFQTEVTDKLHETKTKLDLVSQLEHEVKFNMMQSHYFECFTITKQEFKNKQSEITYYIPYDHYEISPFFLYSINGFTYQPSPVPSSGVSEIIEFECLELTTKSVKCVVYSNGVKINPEFLDKIEMCVLLYARNKQS